MSSHTRTRWAAVGAAVAVTLGAGGLGLANAAGHDSGSVFNTAEPCRILDTRPNFPVGGIKDDGPFTAGEVVTIDTRGGATGQCDPLGDDVVAVALNATAALATEQTHFTFWAGDPAVVPNVSSLNPTEAFPAIPNAVTVDLDEDGTFNVYNHVGEAHLILDVIGVYTAADFVTPEEVEALTNEIWGHWLQADGLAHTSSDDVVVEQVDVGQYCVTFPERETHGVQATGADAAPTIVTVDPHNAQAWCDDAEEGDVVVGVLVFDTDGLAADGDFTFLVPASGPAGDEV